MCVMLYVTKIHHNCIMLVHYFAYVIHSKLTYAIMQLLCDILIYKLTAFVLHIQLIILAR